MRTTIRRLTGISIGLVVAVSLLVSVSVVAAPAQPANAAVGSDFNPGMIISDAIFFNGRSMTVAEIQTFLNAKGKPCLSGYTCLKDYRQTTTSKASDPMCATYTGATNESAAMIIYKVARACSINPRVILVTLEKEQGLVTRNNPTDGIYRKAMGFGCPDTASCDSQFYGFFNQIYKGAWGFQRYTMPAGTGAGTAWYSNYSQYAPGKTVTIQYHPNTACGSSKVYIQNKATGSLYTYTPYRPNAAALANMYGTGNSCSSYGNRNFWRMYTDWFGSTGSTAVATSTSLASLDTTTVGLLGPAIEKAVSYPDGGIGQAFKYGWAYWHSTTGAFRTTGIVGRSYISLLGPPGKLGYPLTDPKAEPNAGSSQAFQKGWLYWSSATNIHLLSGIIGRSYATLGGPSGALGYPLAAAKAEPDAGASQKFQKGWLYWSQATSIHKLSGAIGAKYAALGGPSGVLGYPVAAQQAGVDGQVSQVFQKGIVHSSPTLGAHYVLNALNTQYLTVGGVAGAYGFPTTSTQTYPDGGQSQRFQKAWLYWSAATGLDAVAGALGTTYAAQGGPTGPLGYPIAEQKSESDGAVSQAFQNGTLYSSPTLGAFYVLNALHSEYATLGGAESKYGLPIENTKTYPDGGQSQRFQTAWLYWSAATGVDAVSGKIAATYATLGGPAGRLGYPTAEQKAEPNGGLSQAFQKGTLYWSSTLGTYYALSSMNTAYVKLGGVGGTYGHPVSNTTTYADGGQGQRFKNGWLYWSESTGTDAVSGKIGQSYAALGGPGGRLGYPIAGQKAEPNGGLSQAFQKGSLYWSPTYGIHYMLTSMTAEYLKLGGVGGKFGHPTSSTTTYPDGGQGQRFQNGWLYWSVATGVDATHGRLGSSHAALGGAGGKLGYPTTSQKAEPNGGLSQAYQKGSLYWSPTLGTHFVLKPIADEYARLGGVSSAYGHPTDSTKGYAGAGQGQRFQKAWLFWSAATGYDKTSGSIGTSYVALGGPSGVLGYPVAGQKAEAKSGKSQQFANGWLIWSSITGMDRIAREIGEYYYSVGGSGGQLGYPLGSTRALANGVLEQTFQGGSVRWSAAGGAVRF